MDGNNILRYISIFNLFIPEDAIDPNASQQQYGVTVQILRFAMFRLVNQLWFSCFKDRIECCCRCLIRQPSTSTLVTLSCHKNCYWTWQKLQSLKKSSPRRCLSVWNKSQQTTSFPRLVFICSSLHFRKRIQGFCLLCVSVWPLRGPWCQLRWSAQCICGNKSQHVTIQCRWIHYMAKCSR